jgi:RNA polymerase-binding protein DksA
VDDHQAHATLLAERDTTRARLDALTADVDEVVTAAMGSNVDDEHDPEGATIAFEREQLAALREQARRHLSEVEAALARLAAGRYGTCAECGEEIAAERLAARPAAATCIRCAAGHR